MEITPIETQRDYRRVLKEIEGLMRGKRDTPEGDRLDVLVMLVEAWEGDRFHADLSVIRRAQLCLRGFLQEIVLPKSSSHPRDLGAVDWFGRVSLPILMRFRIP